MIQIPRDGDTPLIKLFQTLEELQRETGQKVAHGFYDPTTNTILATIDSVAHEIGHYRDLKSGRIKNVTEIQDTAKRIEARIRNELVAILFASAKCGGGGAHFGYEVDFLVWLDFMRGQESFGPHSGTHIKDLKLSEIQDLADFLADQNQQWFSKLEYIFRHYLGEEHEVLTYSVKSKQGLTS